MWSEFFSEKFLVIGGWVGAEIPRNHVTGINVLQWKSHGACDALSIEHTTWF